MASREERQSVSSRRLADTVRTVRRRWRLRHMLVGATIVTVVAVAMVALASLLMERAGFSASSVLIGRVVVTLCVVAAAGRYVVVPWVRRVPDAQVALYVEERIPQLDGVIVSAVEAVGGPVADEIRSSALTQGLVRDATDRLQRHGDAPGIERPALRRGGLVLGTVLLAAVTLFAVGPDLLRQGAKLLLTPWRDADAAIAYAITVLPGNASIPRGTDQQVGAELRGFQSESVDLLVRRGSGDTWERIPMERGRDSVHFRTRLFDVEQDAEYVVESHGVRSSVYRLTVRNLPAVKRLDLELRYPRYTGLDPEKIEDTGDIAAVAGTRAVVSVQTTMPIRAGRLVVEGDSSRPLVRGEDGVWRGELTVKRDAFYRVELDSEDGTRVAGAVDYVIDALEDNAPTVRIAKPGRDMRPTLTDEVLVEVQASDDFGVGRMELQFAVNGGATQSLLLQDGTRRSREAVAGHTFFLEELNLKPGDIVSYWAKASDGNSIGGPKTSTSDIYFLTIRPFGRDYRQNQQGGGGGGGGGGEDPGTLTQLQRDIVAATFKTERDQAATPARQFGENVATILMGESRLRERVEKLAQQMSRGIVQAQDSGFKIIAELLPQAAKEMQAAEKSLGERKTDQALPPEQRALQLLERAEAVYREVEVNRGQGGGGGGGGQQSSAQDLADLFELETDKLRNQYEEVRRGNEQASSEKVDETLERLKQLAARQQQENERQRQRAQQGAGGGGGGGSQRELADQAEQMARQLERLARERQSEPMAESARRLQEAATAMRRSAAANGDAGRASGAAALDRMERARRLLEEGRRAGLNQGAEDAARRAEALVQRQREVAKDVEGLAGSGSSRPEKEQQLDTRKQGLIGDVTTLEEDLDRMARDTRRERPDAARQLQEAANALREGRIADKIRFSRGLMRQGTPTAARNFEEQITNDLESLKDRLAKAATGASADSSGQRARALNRAREVVRALASIEERMRAREVQAGAAGKAGESEASGASAADSADRERQGDRQRQAGQQGASGGQEGSGQAGRNGQSGQAGQGGQQGQGGGGSQSQQGQRGQSGQGGQPGRGGNGQGSGMNPGGGQGIAGASSTGGTGSPLGPDELRQFSRELRGQREDAETLRRDLAATGRSTADLERLIARLRAMEGAKALQHPNDLDRLRSSVIEGFKEFEFALRREFGDADGDRPTLGGGDDVPAGYRELVNEYFRSLARRPVRP